jgi:DNA-binding GntR family transcriptional regulator
MLCQRLCQEKMGTLGLLDCSTLDSVPHSAQDGALPCARSSEKVMELAEINRTSVADQVASILRQRILDGELPAGTALQEIPMATSLGVSRNTIREATRILSLEGLLRRNAHRGISVAQLSLKDVAEIYQLRHLLEIPAVLAANPGYSDVFAELQSSLEGYERAVEDANWVRAVRFDLQFHTLLIRFHRNRRLESFYQKLIGELRMGMVLVDRRHDDPGGLVPVHRRIYELLIAGELPECAALITRHLRDSEKRLTEIMNHRISQASAK